MQQKWRLDADKLTFITCFPPARTVPTDGCILLSHDDAPDRMVGDVNLFLFEEDSEESGKSTQRRVIGEVELMVAKKEHQGKGLGRASLVLFLYYVLKYREEIVKERFESSDILNGASPPTLTALRAKIGQTNVPSIKLFESVGFVKKSNEPNYFGEHELELQKMDMVNIGSLMKYCGIEDWREASYENTPYVTLRDMCGLF